MQTNTLTKGAKNTQSKMCLDVLLNQYRLPDLLNLLLLCKNASTTQEDQGLFKEH